MKQHAGPGTVLHSTTSLDLVPDKNCFVFCLFCFFLFFPFIHQTDAALMITKLDEIGELPFKSPPPLCQTNLTRDGLIRKLRGIQKRAGTLEDYYERFNEVSVINLSRI